MSRRALLEARRYVVWAVVAELALMPLLRLHGRLVAATSLACLLFFRDPRRELAPDPEMLYAPADGVVVGVDRAGEKWLDGGEALRISTFLALHDVHVNRSPAAGRIVEAEEVRGGFAPAFLGRAKRNHRKRLAIDDGRRRVVVVQIAGMVARRISSWAWLGDRVAAGQRIGLIHFGSRAELLVPAAEARALVSVGERVRAGVTPLARWERAASTDGGPA